MSIISEAALPIYTMGFNVGSRYFDSPNAEHRHSEIEMIFADGGDVKLLFAGEPTHLKQGDVAVFWAIVPHLAIQCDKGALLWWSEVPTQQFFEWNLPEDFVRRLMQGQFIRDGKPRPETVESYHVRQWEMKLASGDTVDRRIVLLEVEARMRELAQNAIPQGAAGGPEIGVEVPSIKAMAPTGAEDDPVTAMLLHIAENYTSDLTVEAVATHAGLKPSYAMRQFRTRFGVTIVKYITAHRIAHAQRLLVTTDATILDILYDAGFGSVTQFYTAFKATCGCSPLDYRKRNRHRDMG